MASTRAVHHQLAILWLMVCLALIGWSEGHVELGAYNKTCPQAEQIVLDEATSVLARSPDLAGPLLRLFFADCFVGGCEASILVNSTANNTAEKDAALNRGLRGFDVIDGIKAKLEAACPGIVSCADTIALAARDSVRLTKGPYIAVPTGRRDGNRSLADDVAANIPPPSANISQLIASFGKYNLTVKNLVVLSGAHTIGKAHCYSFSDRLYNFTGNGASDPSLDANYTAALRNQCKANDLTTVVDMDPNSTTTFDLDYYKLVSTRRGLLFSDAALLLDDTARAYVQRQANATTTDEFFADFAASFVNMSKIGALTHQKGEIRKRCSAFNPPSSHQPGSAAVRANMVVSSLAGLLLILASVL